MVAILLEKERSLAYVANYVHQSPLHAAAAARNAISAIEEILKRCPDAAEQVDDTGRNALHIAAMNFRVRATECLLKNIRHPAIINKADKDGNTPFHLARMNCSMNPRWNTFGPFFKDTRVNRGIKNHEGITVSKIIVYAGEVVILT